MMFTFCHDAAALCRRYATRTLLPLPLRAALSRVEVERQRGSETGEKRYGDEGHDAWWAGVQVRRRRQVGRGGRCGVR